MTPLVWIGRVLRRCPRLLGGLAVMLTAPGLGAQPAPDAIWSTAAQRWLPYTEFVQALRTADLVFLGEQHDNPFHHEVRARLIADLARPGLRLVFEQLPAQGRFTISPEATDLLGLLRAQGLQDKAWGWPLHAPLFSVAQRLAIPVSGGNLPAGLGRRVYVEGAQALPPSIQKALLSAPLTGVAREALDRALVDGHCGKLPASMAPVMRLIQQATDLSLLLTAQAEQPAIVIAGNGHVQKIFGIPQYVRQLYPAARYWSVGLLERDTPPPDHPVRPVAETDTRQWPSLEDQQRYDFIWLTPTMDREDPCKGFSLSGSDPG
jgi:uncharacterized iron-regulated protein